MIARSVLAALVAGLLAGLVIAGVHHLRLSPLIAAAETLESSASHEHAADGHDAEAAAALPAHDHGEGWKPEEGLQRIAATTVSLALTGAGFALLLAAVSLLSGIEITPANAFAWGAAGFLAASLAPAAGLPPGLPGMPEASLAARQLWWTFTVASTGLALLMLAARPLNILRIAGAAVLVLLPHVIGAPAAPAEASAVPASLATSFVASTLAISALFWLIVAVALAYLMPRQQLAQERAA
jgi:cobalt transporter subunit CbtA